MIRKRTFFWIYQLLFHFVTVCRIAAQPLRKSEEARMRIHQLSSIITLKRKIMKHSIFNLLYWHCDYLMIHFLWLKFQSRFNSLAKSSWCDVFYGFCFSCAFVVEIFSWVLLSQGGQVWVYRNVNETLVIADFNLMKRKWNVLISECL